MDGVAAARERAERWMTASCVIREPGGMPVFDVETMSYPERAGDEVYDGKCRVHSSRGGQRVGLDVAGAVTTLRTVEIDIPVGAETLRKDQVLTLVDVDDPYLVGRPLRVEDVQGSSNSVYRRLVCIDTLVADVDDESGGS